MRYWRAVGGLGLLYGAQNVLTMYALRSGTLSGVTFSLLQTTKLPWTVAFSYILLGRRQTVVSLLAVVVVLCTSVQIVADGASGEQRWDLAALCYSAVVILETLISGIACVVNEGIVGGSVQELAVFNTRLSAASVIVYAGAAAASDDVSGTSATTVLVGAIGAVGGLLVAATFLVGAVEKTIAGAMSLVLTVVMEAAWLHQWPRVDVTCTAVICACTCVTFHLSKPRKPTG